MLSITFAAFMTLPVVACKGGGGGNTPAKEGVLNVMVVAKGYGSAFADDLATAFTEANSGVTVNVKSTTTANLPETQLGMGKKNTVDLYFTISNNVFATQVVADGYKWADLSDVYESDAVGYKETGKIKDIINPYYYEAMTYTDGKQYAVPWTSGSVGILYNKTLWDKTNAALKAAGKTELTLPVTTNEMFELFDRIKTSDVKSASNGAYAISYSGQDSYMQYLFNDLWKQYEGTAAVEAFYEGKNENGVYTADIYNTKGRLDAYEVVRNVILQANGYVNSKDISTDFKIAQVDFLRGTAFFSCNGDWLEREAASQFNPGEADAAFIRTPVLSTVVDNPKISADFTGDSAAKDAKLRAIVNFIDENYINGDKTVNAEDATTLGVGETTLKFLYESRMSKHVLPDFMAVVPEYAVNLELAKDFLKFMYSKDGQEILMLATYGAMSPLSVDVTQFDYYENARPFSKSKLDIAAKQITSGKANNYPIQYLGGIKDDPRDSMASAFGSATPSHTAAEYQKREYDWYRDNWNDIMSGSGVSNS